MSRQTSKENTARLFNRYVWLVDLIYRYSGRITFEEINERWLTSDLNIGAEELPIKTFHNHKTAIKTMFDIDIECDRKNGYVYYIDNADDMERGGARQWLVNTFAVNNLINESHKLKHRILFENIPSGQRFLTLIIEAMRDSRTVEINYKNYGHDQTYTFEIDPYCVKVFKQRWYLVANSVKGIRIYSLDKILELRQTDNSFSIPKEFDAKEYFRNSFGIITDRNVKAEEVVLKVATDDNTHLYMQSLPLHHSQQVVEQNEHYAVFKYFLRPTYDFRQEILSHGVDIEVLSPQWFREQIADVYKTQNKLYGE